MNLVMQLAFINIVPTHHISCTTLQPVIVQYPLMKPMT